MLAQRATGAFGACTFAEFCLLQLCYGLMQLRLDAPAVEGVGQDLPDQPHAVDHRVRPIASIAERADYKRADGLPADADRDGLIRQEADAATVFPLLQCLAGEIAEQAGQADGLAADELHCIEVQPVITNKAISLFHR